MAESNGTLTVGVELVGTYSIDTKAFWLDLLDRTGKTFFQTLLIFLAGGATIVSVSWTTALSSAALASLVSFLIALSTSTALTSGNFAIDLADRVGRTFVSALVGAIPASGTLSDINWHDALTLAATAALISVLTSLASSNFGSTKGLPSLAPVQPALIAIDETDDEVLPAMPASTGLIASAFAFDLADAAERPVVEVQNALDQIYARGHAVTADLDLIASWGLPVWDWFTAEKKTSLGYTKNHQAIFVISDLVRAIERNIGSTSGAGRHRAPSDTEQ
ncbi:hypothetical protein JCM9803A_63500 [Rhodococcus erythropolis]